MLLQFAEKHNMRVAYDIMERRHINCTLANVEGTEIETCFMQPGEATHKRICEMTLQDQSACNGVV